MLSAAHQLARSDNLQCSSELLLQDEGMPSSFEEHATIESQTVPHDPLGGLDLMAFDDHWLMSLLSSDSDLGDVLWNDISSITPPTANPVLSGIHDIFESIQQDLQNEQPPRIRLRYFHPETSTWKQRTVSWRVRRSQRTFGMNCTEEFLV
jgi:hypothetical protein